MSGRFTIDPWADLSEAEVRKQCRRLSRSNFHKERIIYVMALGGMEALPKEWADEVRNIVEAYRDDKTPEA